MTSSNAFSLSRPIGKSTGATPPGSAANPTRLPSKAPAPSYELSIDLPRLIERMHRRFLDIVRAELTRLDAADLNPVQAMQLLDIEDEMTVQELIDRGHYIGSNALYNVRKLSQAGYLEPSRSPTDRRALRVKLTEKGAALCNALKARIDAVPTSNGHEGGPQELDNAFRVLRNLERAWDDHLRFGRG
ncbi:MAG: winged helix DNA-binding protein [Alphaproteobacteria bacterium]|nr:winged helix DNA-binding protein [Alphaproteobacteria bacterium]